MDTMTTNPDDTLISAHEAANILDVTPRTIRRRALNGDIPAVKLGENTRLYVFRRGDVIAYRDGVKA